MAVTVKHSFECTVPSDAAAKTQGQITSDDWNDDHTIEGLATVATSGSYNDLSDQPTIPDAYTLPTASTTVLGGVKVDGTTVTITDGVISSSGSGMTNPMTTAGDFIVGGTGGTPTRLAAITGIIKGSGSTYSAATAGTDYQSPLLVAETVVSGSAVTSVTFSGLDGNAAGGYVLVCEFTPASATDCTAYLHCNNDTTNTNYMGVCISIGDAGTVGAVRTNSRNVVGTFSTTYPVSFSVSDIGIANSKIIINSELMYRSVTTPAYLSSRIIHNSTQTNITSLSITSNVASSIGVGSTFRLYKRK